MIKKLVISIDMPSGWLEFCSNVDVISYNSYCGYWAEYWIDISENNSPSIKWLIYYNPNNNDSIYPLTKVDSYQQAYKAASAGSRKMPEHWYLFDEEIAIKAYLEGVKKWGMDWYNDPNTDGRNYDTAIQLALFGKLVFG